ncbi:hypothetical protein H8356DRAFT_1352877 [Neocallimastix lanati (nom. inval.)]|nr:hypothetical protein H8356DRAFT_1352877 [Neocallimastix sp. JGI-2020a]
MALIVNYNKERIELIYSVFPENNKISIIHSSYWIIVILGINWKVDEGICSAFNVSTHEGAGTFQALANKELTSPKANWASGL